MKDRKGWMVSVLVLGCALFSGGCVDAIVDGVALGVTSGIEAAVQNVITNAAETLLPGDSG